MPSPRSARKSRANGEGTVYQRKDGRWEAAGYVLTTSGTRKRTRVYGSTRKEAVDKLTERMAANNRGLPAPAADCAIGVYLQHWLDNIAVHQLRETTHTRYRATARLYINPILGKKKLGRLATKDVRAFLDQLRTQCQCCIRGLDTQGICCSAGNCCGKRLSPLTVSYVHSVLKSALQHAVREDELPRNVARNVPASTPRPKRTEPLTAAEARQLLRAAEDHRLQALFELALHTGLRKGELLGLQWSDLDLDSGTANIRRTLQRTSSRGLTTLPTKTTSSERRITLPATCIHSLQAHRRRQEQEGAAAGDGWQESGYVFTTPTGRPIDPTNLTRAFTTLLNRSGLRRIRFHDLRHTAATLLLEQGVELVVIKELLGHAHIGVTAAVYAHVRPRLQQAAITTLSNALSADTAPSGTAATP
ncbi:site-specific integrase [Streptomyces sp. XM83C]|uniref:Tyrosine-type recombinase/integrase n=1 Tax=Streptomyces thermocoprophilus TaxID=78356 RepID=A0ABV5VMV7_9ACTN|nr:tyrosine-type recombinase/integrase [Streptomyces sp. XM83C]MCK1823109.1 site-specific integrase [Streptomyces sp. XM83C]